MRASAARKSACQGQRAGRWRPAAGGVGETAGQGEQPAAEGSRPAWPAVGEPEQLGPAAQVVGEAGDHRPGGVSVEAAGGEVPECLVDQVADHELDDGVLAMLALDELERLVAVGDEGEVLPGREQLLLIAEGTHAADDQSLVCECRLGDLRLACFGVVDKLTARAARSRQRPAW